MEEAVFIAKNPCGCNVAALFPMPNWDPADRIQELGEFLAGRTPGQTIEVASPDTRVGVTIPGGCSHKQPAAPETGGPGAEK